MKWVGILFCFSLLLGSCSPKKVEVVSSEAVIQGDGMYDSEMPSKSIAPYIEHISSTVKKLNVVAFYMKYEFAPGVIKSKADLTKANILLHALSSKVDSESVSGTVTVVYAQNGLVGMLTADHILDFPDTVIGWYRNESLGIGGVAIKMSQKNFVAGIPESSEVEIVLRDKEHDIAFLKKKRETQGVSIPVFNYPLGNIRYLDWASVVYIVGYPLGNLMVTQAIASKPRNRQVAKFITDAIFNHGISGSPVVALRDGVPNFELVGMAVSTSAKNLLYLRPYHYDESVMPTEEIYQGDMVVARQRVINYGVTYSVSVNTIVDFLKINKLKLEKEGFNVDLFFK